MTHHNHHGRGGAAIGLGLAVLATGIVAAAAVSRNSRRMAHGPEDAPLKALKDAGLGEQRVVGRSVTIARPRDELYRIWRDFGRFPEFMENVRSVQALDERRSRWTVEGPGGAPIEFVSRIVDDRPGEVIAWEAEEDAAVRNSGRVTFRDAPAGRGTEVDLTVAYEPPGGVIGAMVAKMFQREPAIQARRDLKRFKQLMETGEIATASTHPDAPAAAA